MKLLKSHIVLAAIAAAISASAHQAGSGASHEAADVEFLQNYESIRVALAADDLAAAKSAAGAIKEDQNAEALAGAGSLPSARESFKQLSKRAVKVATDHDGLFLAHCPMVKGGGGDWVQASPKVGNPYFGKSMLTCGSIRPAKAPAAGKPAEHKHH